MWKIVVALVVLCAVAGSAGTSLAHSSGCHSAHSCPSDHHTYVWFDGSGAGWDCVRPGASEYDAALDTTVISYDGYTYYCRAAGSAPVASAPPADADGDGVPDSSDACPAEPAATADGCPAPAAPVFAVAPAAACHVNGALPDRHCSPGATLHVTRAQVCTRGYSKRVRNVPQSVKDRVYAEYGIASHTAGQYEVDHLISLELGGSNAIKNLFPEAALPRPGFHEKDRLENRLHAQVCARKMTLRAAQRAIRTNWVKAYRRAFG